MTSSPRNIRLSQDALAAVKILRQASSEKSISELVSESLVRAANEAVAAPVLQFARIDPGEYLGIYAALAELTQQHQRLKKDLLRIRPTDKEAAEKLANAINKAEGEIIALGALRQRLAKMAKATASITSEDATMLVEQVAPGCRQAIAKSENQNDFSARKSRAIFNLILSAFPQTEND